MRQGCIMTAIILFPIGVLVMITSVVLPCSDFGSSEWISLSLTFAPRPIGRIRGSL